MFCIRIRPMDESQALTLSQVFTDWRTADRFAQRLRASLRATRSRLFVVVDTFHA